jgi:hypothetical protein
LGDLFAIAIRIVYARSGDGARDLDFLRVVNDLGQRFDIYDASRATFAPVGIMLLTQWQAQLGGLDVITSSVNLAFLNLAHSLGNSCRTEKRRTMPAAVASAICAFRLATALSFNAWLPSRAV